MSLNPGTRLGSYEVLGPLGAGGMGEVYSARDTRLDRTVAIKVLPDAFASDQERLTRFEREAKLLASLNHPNVATLYGFDTTGGVSYLAMELVPGETLAERIQRGPIPVDEALPLFIQIALGLEAAHQNGVIHRDLKPANIKVTPDDKVKVLDFGLAKAYDTATEMSPGLSASPTMTAAATIRGEIMGTAGYMSPEQARGKPVDRRTDVWAFGCVVYEALTGNSPFTGETITDTLAAVVRADPEWEKLPADLPRPFRKLLRRCLEKDANRRLHDIADARIELEEVLSGGVIEEDGPAAAAQPVVAPVKSRPVWTIVLPTALLAILATFSVISVFRRPARPETGPVQRFVVGAASLTGASAPAISPDGRTIVYSVDSDGKRQLYRRALDSFEALPIAGTEGGKGPFFSPDGIWVGFNTPEALKKVPLIGGTAITLCGIEGISSAEWGSDGTILFALHSGGWDGKTALGRVAETGGRPEAVLPLDEATSESETWLPEFLPGGKAILYSAKTGMTWRIVAAFPDGTRKMIQEGGFEARWSEEGYLLYVDDESEVLYAAPFDPRRVEFTGAAVPLIAEVDNWYCFDLSPEGTLVYVAKMEGGKNTVAILDRSGAITPMLETPGPWAQPRVSPDGRRVLVRKTGTNCDLWIHDLDRRVFSRLTREGDSHDPVWAPDGRRVIVSRDGVGSTSLVILSADGSADPLPYGQGDVVLHPESWSRDGRILACTATGSGTKTDIWTIPMSGDGAATPFLRTEFREADPAFSPDLSWIACASDESGRFEIYLRAFPGPGPRIQVSTDGGRFPVWSPTGRELFFISGSKMMVTDIEPGAEPRVGTPRVLFEGAQATTTRSYDLMADGKSFVMARALEGSSGLNEIRVVQNWAEDLRRMTTGTARH